MASQQSQSHYHSDLMQMVLLWTPFLWSSCLAMCFTVTIECIHCWLIPSSLMFLAASATWDGKSCCLGWSETKELRLFWGMVTKSPIYHSKVIIWVWGRRCSDELEWGSAEVKIWTSDHQRMLDDWLLSLVTELALKPISQCAAFNLSVLFLPSISVLSLPLSLIVLSILQVSFPV